MDPPGTLHFPNYLTSCLPFTKKDHPGPPRKQASLLYQKESVQLGLFCKHSERERELAVISQ